jgi:hypothetical protein
MNLKQTILIIKTQTMKNLLLLTLLFFAVSFSYSQTNEGDSLKIELKEALTFDKGNLPEKMNNREFIIFSFNITEKGIIKVIDFNSSNEEIKTIVMKKLSNTFLDPKLISSKIQYYKIFFKKL